MAYSIIRVAGNGTSDYAINFVLGFNSRDEVRCQVDGAVDGLGDPVYKDLTWINDGLVTVADGPYDNTHELVFTRTVDKNELIHDYSDGEPIIEQNLDESNKQTLMAVHEVLDGRLESPLQQDLDMGGFRIVNMGAAEDPDDAVTLEQTEEVLENIDAITTVADNITDVVTVADNIADVNTVADNIASVTAVAANSTNINTVAGIDTEITTVAGIDSEVVAVASIDSEVVTVAGNSANINTVAGISSDVSAVAAIDTEVQSVAGNSANINAVAANSTNINSVAGNSTNINAVASNSTNINTVAGINAAVSSVASNSTNINTVAGISSDVSAVAGNITDVQNAEENALIAKAAAGYSYTYSTTTTASDPGSGYLRFNNATLASATALYISETTGLSQAIATAIATWDDSTSTIKGTLRMFSQNNPSIFAIFSVTGSVTDNGSWDTLTVAYVSGSGSFTNNTPVTIQFVRNGDKGDNGAPGSTIGFSAGRTSDQTIANNTWTKYQANIEDWDTNACYDNATNYRFTPNVSGKYLVIFSYRIREAGAGQAQAVVYKNGTSAIQGLAEELSSVYSKVYTAIGIVDMNGTTDYLEAYVYQSSGGNLDTLSSSAHFDQFTAVKVADTVDLNQEFPLEMSLLGSVTNGTYVMHTYAIQPFVINSIKGVQSTSGTCTLNVKINSTSVTGLSAISVTSTPQNVTATGANTVAIGDKVSFTVTSASSLTDILSTLSISRTS